MGRPRGKNCRSTYTTTQQSLRGTRSSTQAQALQPATTSITRGSRRSAVSRETTGTAVAGVSTGASRGVAQQGAEQAVNVSSVSGGVNVVNDSNMVTSVSTTVGASSTTTTSTVSMSQATTTGSSGENSGSLNQLAWLNPANQGEQNTSSSQANSTNVSGIFNVPLPFIPSPVSMATNMPLQLTSVCAPLGVSVEQKIREKNSKE